LTDRSTGDPFDLERFAGPQNAVWPRVLAEMAAGRKQSHWIWFVFPQVMGLGASFRSAHFAIRSRAEAQAYLAHPVLGPRLREITTLALRIENRSARDIFGDPDDLKFRSSMTLFDAIAPSDIFAAALDKYFNGEHDDRTLSILHKTNE
jgi:uncharacterized protein (DUF1810 family)